MEKAQSKRKSGTADPETKVLPPIIKLMTERYPGRMDQFELWVKLGFPENGSLSLGQLDQLKTCLEAKEKRAAEEHAAMSESKQKKNHLFKGDWKAYSMWREEAEGKEKSRLRGQMKNAGHTKEPTNTMYPSLPEESKSHNPFCGVDPDLDSAPPPPYTPPLNQDEAGKQKSHQHHHQPLLQHPSTRRKRTQMKGSEKSMENGQAAHRERLISFDKPIT